MANPRNAGLGAGTGNAGRGWGVWGKRGRRAHSGTLNLQTRATVQTGAPWGTTSEGTKGTRPSFTMGMCSRGDGGWSLPRSTKTAVFPSC